MSYLALASPVTSVCKAKLEGMEEFSGHSGVWCPAAADQPEHALPQCSADWAQKSEALSPSVCFDRLGHELVSK